MADPTVIETEDLREEVRRRYAEAAGSSCGCGDPFGAKLYDDSEREEAAALEASLGCGNPTAVADLHEGETVLDLGSGRGWRCAALGAPGGAVREGLRPRHDRRDARAGARERARGRTRERGVPEGRDRGDPAAGRVRRRGDLQLRDQPVRRQAGGAGRGRAGASPRRALRGVRRDRRRGHGRRRPAPTCSSGPAASRARSPSASSARSSRPPASRRSRSWRLTACTSTRDRRSSGRASRDDRAAVACCLSADELGAARARDPRRCSRTRSPTRAARPHGSTLRFADGSSRRVEALAEAERRCCAFLTFRTHRDRPDASRPRPEPRTPSTASPRWRTRRSAR